MDGKFVFDESIVKELTHEERAELEKQMENPETQKAMKKLESIFTQEDTTWLGNVQSAEELQNGLKDRGVEMDFDTCQKLYKEAQSGQQDELSEADLDEVAGGGVVLGALIIIGGLAIAGIGGYCAYRWLKKNLCFGANKCQK